MEPMTTEPSPSESPHGLFPFSSGVKCHNDQLHQSCHNLSSGGKTTENNMKKRKRVRGINNRAQNKLLRMKGLPYVTANRNHALDEGSCSEGGCTDGRDNGHLAREGRVLGPPCEAHKSAKSHFQCHQFSENFRRKSFDTFWQEKSWEERKVLIKTLVEVKPAKVHRKEGSKRNETPVYSLKNEDGTKLRVCKPFFLSTFSLGRRMVDGWTKDPRVDAPPEEPPPRPKPAEIKIESKDKKLRNKILRMKGLPYVGLQRYEVETEGEKKTKKKYVLGAQREGRSMGPGCEVHRSSKSSFQCHEFPDSVRRKYFDHFWQELNWGERKEYVRGLVEVKPVKKHLVGGEPTRNDAVFYHLKSTEDEMLLRVCKPFFMSTFGIRKRMLDHWCKKDPKEESSQKDPTAEAAVKFAQRFLTLLPKHYRQRSQSKLFLEPIITAKIQLYRIYKDYCERYGQPSVSMTKFKSVLEEMNLSVFSPKKDVCSICERYKDGEVGEDAYKAHQMKKERAMSEKKFDKEQCVKGVYNGITVDLQAVRQAPFIPLQSSIYFKAKLNVYSYSVYNLGNDKVRCYWWDETQGDLVASSFVSCLLDYLDTFNSDHRPIVIFSNGCGYQNRNTVMSNALLNYAMRRRKIIYQKFIDKEHCQTECDSVHADIDRKLKDMDIRLPRDYVDVCRAARRHPTSRYEAKEIDYSFFRDYTNKFFQRYGSIRPGSKAKDPHETDIQALKYDPNGQIFFKIHFDDDWKPLPKKPKQLVAQETAPPLFQSPVNLDFKKFSDLQELKQLLPAECHQFYDRLPHEPHQSVPAEFPPPSSATEEHHEAVQVEFRHESSHPGHMFESAEQGSGSSQLPKSRDYMDSAQPDLSPSFGSLLSQPHSPSDFCPRVSQNPITLPHNSYPSELPNDPNRSQEF